MKVRQHQRRRRKEVDRHRQSSAPEIAILLMKGEHTPAQVETFHYFLNPQEHRAFCRGKVRILSGVYPSGAHQVLADNPGCRVEFTYKETV